MLKKIIKYIPGVAIPMVINFIITLLYARSLQPGEYGVLNIYLNTIQIIYAATVSIFQNASLRFYSLKKEYKDETEFVSTYVLASLATTIILLPVLYIANLFGHFNWWIIALSVGCNGVFQIFITLHRVKYQSKHYNTIRTFAAIISLVALIGFSLVIKPLIYVWPIIAVYGSYGLMSIYELVTFRHSISLRRFSINLICDSFNYGFPLIGVALLGYVIANCDQYFLLYFLGKEAVGNYALGHRLVDALVVNLLTMILLVMTPELNRIHDESGEIHSKEVLKKMINSALWIILPLSLAIIIYAKPIIQYIFPAYTSAAQIMQLVVFASIFHGLSMFTCKGLELVKHPKYIFYGLLTAAIINCTYNWVFIPIYGINASAHSSSIAYITYNVLLVFFTKKYYNLRFDVQYIVKVLLVSAGTVGIAILIMTIKPILSVWALIMEGVISAVIYLGGSYLFGLLKVFR